MNREELLNEVQNKIHFWMDQDLFSVKEMSILLISLIQRNTRPPLNSGVDVEKLEKEVEEIKESISYALGDKNSKYQICCTSLDRAISKIKSILVKEG